VAGDSDLIQIVDAAMAEAVRKSGSWIACKPGCMQCCLGSFPITRLDAARLRSGLVELERTDPIRAASIRVRAIGYKDTDEGDEPCPALDPATGTCDLYQWRPVTCRMFGPAVRAGGDAMGVCELCYEGAADQEIAACVVDVDIEAIERELLAGDTTQTTVAEALR
jgi:Fe-S-cluster containining protein